MEELQGLRASEGWQFRYGGGLEVGGPSTAGGEGEVY
jgi:hypothetical protein